MAESPSKSTDPVPVLSTWAQDVSDMSKQGDGMHRRGGGQAVNPVGRSSGTHHLEASGESAVSHIASAHDEGEQDDMDLEAIKETCQQMTDVVKRFNSCIGKVHPIARGYIETMNNSLSMLLVKQETARPIKPSNSSPPLLSSRAGSKSLVMKSEFSDSSGSADSVDCPKLKKKKQRVRFGGFDSEPNNSELDTSDSAGSAPSDQRKGDRNCRRTSRRNKLSTADVLRALARLDNRSVPRPESFDTQSGQPFEQFLSVFEDYCKHNFRGSSSLWIGELGRLLKGDMHSAFEAVKVPGDSYDSLRSKLLKWRTDTREVLESKTKYRFTKAQIQSGESLRLYAARLEKAFRLAYPNRGVETSKTLRRKYLDTVPRDFEKQLQTARSINMTMNGSELLWSTILTLASQTDVGEERRNRGGDSLVKPDDEQVWLTYPNRHCSPQRRISPVVSLDSGYDRDRDYARNQSRYDTWLSSSNNVSAQSQSRDSMNRNNSRARSVSRPDRGVFWSQSRSNSSPPVNRQPSPREENMQQRTCFHCHKPGHIKNQCRRLLNLCLVCGSSEHRISSCPRRRFGVPPISGVSINRNTASPTHQSSRNNDSNRDTGNGGIAGSCAGGRVVSSASSRAGQERGGFPDNVQASYSSACRATPLSPHAAPFACYRTQDRSVREKQSSSNADQILDRVDRFNPLLN